MLVLLAGCNTPPPGLCFDPKHCDEGFNCNPPDFTGSCTTTVTVSPPCDIRGEACTAGAAPGLCWYVDGECGIEHECRVACTVGDDSTCYKPDDLDDEGAPIVPQVCRADGMCTPASCMDGEHTCPADTTCVEAGGDANGCMHPSCTDAKDCGEDQHCVVGRCFLELGTCTSAVF